MLLKATDRSPESAPAPDAAEGTILGKRYVLADVGLEVLCTKAGAGSLAFNDSPLAEQSAKPLPASD